MAEIKQITAVLESKAQEKKRHVFVFTNPDGGEYPLKIAAFEPHIPDLKIGEAYTFDCEFVPMKDDATKFYKNFVRASRDGEYKIKQADGLLPAPMGNECSPPTKNPAGKKNLTTSTSQQDKEILKEISAVRHDLSQAQSLIAEALNNLKQKQSSEYWEKRDKSIVRQACVKAAAQIVSNQKTENAKQAIETTLEIAQALAEYCNGDEKQ